MATIPPIGTSAYKAYARASGLPSTVPVIPPVGTSAYKAYQYQQKTGRSATSDGLRNFRSLVSGVTPSYAQSGPMSKDGSLSTALFGSGSSAGYSGGSSSSEGSGGTPALEYYNAALAQHYGMDASTAYQEALANTSYQRSVRDMLDAGLNPSVLFAAGRVSGADGVGYATQIGSGFGGSTGGGSAKNKYVFGKGLYQALQVVGGGLAVAATKHASSYFAGQSAAKGVMQAINGLFR